MGWRVSRAHTHCVMRVPTAALRDGSHRRCGGGTSQRSMRRAALPCLCGCCSGGDSWRGEYGATRAWYGTTPKTEALPWCTSRRCTAWPCGAPSACPCPAPKPTVPSAPWPNVTYHITHAHARAHTHTPLFCTVPFECSRAICPVPSTPLPTCRCDGFLTAWRPSSLTPRALSLFHSRT